MEPGRGRRGRDGSREVHTQARGARRSLPDEIDATIERIAETPEHFQRWPEDPSYRRAVVHVFPFIVFYWIDEPRHTVLIVSVAAAKREPGYWK